MEALAVIRKMIARGPEEKKMFRTISEAMADKPETGTMVMMSLFSYAQVRTLYDSGQFWDPEVADRMPTPELAAVGEGTAGLSVLGG